MRKIFHTCVALLLILAGCASSTQEKDDVTAQLKDEHGDRARELISVINTINSKAPDTIRAGFTIDGTAQGKKFKSTGTMNWQDSPRAMYASFIDYIFKSPVTLLFQEKDRLSVYYPVDKTLVTDTVSQLNLQNYIGFSVPAKVVYDLVTMRLPIIENSRVTRCLGEEGKDCNMIVFENSKWFETIVFENDRPVRIMTVHKADKTRAEFYLERPTTIGESRVYRRIRIILPEQNVRLTVAVYNISLNQTVSIRTVEKYPLPQGVKIIRRN